MTDSKAGPRFHADDWFASRPAFSRKNSKEKHKKNPSKPKNFSEIIKVQSAETPKRLVSFSEETWRESRLEADSAVLVPMLKTAMRQVE